MKLIEPDYYKSFACIAGDCAHNCCIGWEIDIDEDTYKYYMSLDNEQGERLKRAISLSGGTPHFILGEDERCPFLNRENLCDVIINLGEDKLCAICTDHPRFRNFFDGRTEIGLGLSCESASRLILNHKPKTTLVCVSDDGTDAEDDIAERDFFKLRKRVIDIIQNRDKPIDERAVDMLREFEIRLPQKTAGEWADAYLELERLDPMWTNELQKIKHAPQNIKLLSGAKWDTAFEQLIVYFLYRHMPDGIYDGTLKARMAFAAHAYYFLRLMCGIHAKEENSFSVNDMAEIARMYSAEIEYSSENTERILMILSQEA